MKRMRCIDERAGEESIFREFTKGDSLTFTFAFTDADGVTPKDVTGYKVYVAFSSKKDSTPPDLEVEIPAVNPEEGMFAGIVTDEQTRSLTAGTIYASAKYVDLAGNAFIIDKAKGKVYDGVNSPRT